MKKIIINSILSILIPFILIGFLSVILDNTKLNYAYIVCPILFMSILINLYFIYFKYNNKLLIIFIILINIGLFIYTFIIFNNPIYMLIGIVGINLCVWLVNKYKIFIFTYVLVIYPIIFYSYDFNYTTIIIYISYMALFMLYYLYKKYHKTKIYLYDNYD